MWKGGTMTYKEKAVNLIMQRLGVNFRSHAEEIVELIDKEGEFKPCVLGELRAPEDLDEWDAEIE